MPRLNDLCGQRFGRLVVVTKVAPHVNPSGKKVTRWLCQCDCGNTTIVRAESLKSGATQSCGCYRKEIAKDNIVGVSKPRDIINIAGKRFGSLTVLSIAPRQDWKTQAAHWLCRCDCGNTVIVEGIKLRNGNKKSCGCYGVDGRFGGGYPRSKARKIYEKHTGTTVPENHIVVHVNGDINDNRPENLTPLPKCVVNAYTSDGFRSSDGTINMAVIQTYLLAYLARQKKREYKNQV